MNLVEPKLTEIRNLCKKHQVSELFVFGSVLTTGFSEESDVDFLVDFLEINLHSYADNYFDFKEELETLLHRPVDLLEAKALKNPYLKKAIESSKQLVYAARN